MSRARRLAGSAALVATAGGLAATAVHDLQWIEWSLLAFSGVVGLAGAGLARQSLVAQILSRGTAWVVLVPSALVTVISTLGGHAPDALATGLAAGSGAALLLARPMLHTAAARAAFAPSWFRRWLLAAATASVTAGIVTGMFSLDSLRWHNPAAVALCGLALSLLASAIGVVRMRAWGILLGGVTSLVTLIAAGVMHDAAGFALSLTAIPGLMLALPVILAKHDRARSRRAQGSAHVRVATDTTYAALPARVRVASEPAIADGADAHRDAFDEGDAPGRRASVQA